MFHSERHVDSIADPFKPRVHGPLRPVLLATAVCGLFAGVAASAAEYEVLPSVNGRLFVDDNLLLRSDGREIETVLFELTPRLQVRRTTEKWQAAVDVSASFERLEDDEFDSDNQSASLQLVRQAETMQFQLVALNSRVNTRSTELDELGQVGFDVDRRDRQFVRPGVTWTLNPKNQLAFGISGENVHYGGFNFSDYDYYSADIAWTHQYDEKTRFELSTFGSEYTAVPPFARVDQFFTCVFGFDGIDEFGSETLGVQIGGFRQPTSRLNYRGSLGYRDVKNLNERQCFEIDGSLRILESSSSSDGFILDTGVTYQGEKYGLDLGLSRSVTPVGLGFLAERDTFILNMSYRYSEHITGTLIVNGFKTESTDEAVPFEQEGFRVTPGVNWRFNEKLSLNGGVIYRSAESLNVDGEREGLSAYVGFNYNFKPIRFNR